MATDIHLHLEIRNQNQDVWHKCLSFGGEFLLKRHYPMFYRLYGNSDYLISNIKYIVPYRGFPTNASVDVFEEYALKVIDGENVSFVNQIGLTVANDWIEKNECQYVTNDNIQGSFINNPDWHTPNWINCQELESCMLDIQCMECWKNEEWEFCWYVLLQNMKLYDSLSNYEVRAVYWFDN